MAIPEAKIRQAAERAWMPQIGARGGTAARPRTSPGPMPLGPSSGAHPLTSPPSSRLPESIPKPGMDSETAAPRHEQHMSKRPSSPSHPVREYKNTRSYSTPMSDPTDKLYLSTSADSTPLEWCASIIQEIFHVSSIFRP
ncbi:hypothetical protein PILCRDRAFT_813609 [Piloderma croceum F 1598]|uniref:Uncharacterized protein n=1 Tax=Piloderma croceum (strain F 1598) TaxID=765440 RepID=A0A0C3FWX4_PILCF|nr:hypothetical protein PILCRDRAFT_813609 [Piloderma croceum F 1598]